MSLAAVTGLFCVLLLGACNSGSRHNASVQVRVFGSVGYRYHYSLEYRTPSVLRALKVALPLPRPGLPGTVVIPTVPTMTGTVSLPWTSPTLHVPKGTSVIFILGLDGNGAVAYRCDLYSDGHLIDQCASGRVLSHPLPGDGWLTTCVGTA